ncbi:hypothetical protein [Kaistia sp. MMO-174]|uniref:hypothetical protein n=1 Tax=Kaistia sp. MMO-174 TaxID=3081256 RepID=UPI0030159EBA
MVNNAWERAVEAGARALAHDSSGHDTYWRSHVTKAEIPLRAAFPILAEELVKLAEAENNAAIDNGIGSTSNHRMIHHMGRSEAAITITTAIRARIEQMKEITE